MKINHKEESQVITVFVEGWLDVMNCAEMEDYINHLPVQKEVVLDFKELEYISSAGIRSIIATYKKHKEAGNDLKIINVNDDVMDIFSLTGINKKISIKKIV